MNKFEYIKNELIFDNLLVNLASLPSFIKIDMPTNKYKNSNNGRNVC